MYDVEIVTQKGDVDCGPVCMTMLLRYYGEEVTLDQMIEECGLPIGGCTGKDILRVGRAHGLDMKSFRMDAEELIQQDRPGIIWWMYNHFVVFCGQDENGNVVIANPGRGRFAIDVESFGKLFTGITFWNGEPVQVIQRATKQLAEGEYFQLNGELCRAIAPIANGAILTLNTNYRVTTVENEFTVINS